MVLNMTASSNHLDKLKNIYTGIDVLFKKDPQGILASGQP